MPELGSTARLRTLASLCFRLFGSLTAIAFGATLGGEISRFLVPAMVYDQTFFALSLLGEMVWLPIGGLLWFRGRSLGRALQTFDLFLLRVNIGLVILSLAYGAFAVADRRPTV